MVNLMQSRMTWMDI